LVVKRILICMCFLIGAYSAFAGDGENLKRELLLPPWCMSDSFGYQWSISATLNSGIFEVVGSVLVGEEVWMAYGEFVKTTKILTITAVNPSSDGCLFESDSFTYVGNFDAFTFSGTWTNSCGYSGNWFATLGPGACTFDSLFALSAGPANGDAYYSKLAENAENGPRILASPNPFKNRISLTYNTLEKSSLLVEVYDMTGKLIKELERGEFDAGVHEFEWNGRNEKGSKVSAGVYICSFRSNEGVAFSRIIKN